MAEGVLFSIAGGIVANLASEALKQIRLPSRVKDDLRKLEATINAIKAVLLDAEENSAINNQVKVWLDSLEDVIYDADNLIDEFRYQQLKRKVLFGKKRARKVRIFFSSSNQLVFRRKMAKKIKQIREMLDEIKDNQVFLQLNQRPEETRSVSPMSWRETHSFVIDSEVIGREKDKKELLHLDERLEETRVVSPMSSSETHSHVIDSEVIGRERDKKELLGVLLDNNIDNKENVSVASLVGLGGLGKTTLAQVVFNDESVKKHFNKNTFWVCVSDSFDLRPLLEKIIRSATETGPDSNLNLQQLQNKVREQIENKKYLLVLDDVWNEDEGKWEALETFLKLGAKGSRVLITTRSINVARIVHSSKTHMLSGLDKNKSWTLFERLAFEDRNYEPTEYSSLVEIGKDIVAKCKGVPLAIKTVGRLLKSKINSLQMLDVRKWISFRDVELAKVDYENETDILPTLKLSYNNLPSHLKCCFAYSSLFPKDHRIDVQELIRLWIAQGFVKPIRNYKIGYEYFMILFLGCFFQEAEMDELLGSIKYCKMHDLMHDLASLVAGKSIEILDASDRDNKNSFEKVRHAYVDFKSDGSGQIPTLLFEQKKMRSFILPKSSEISSSECDGVLSNFKFLRALSLHDMEVLPNSFHKLKHLKYLNLSENDSIKELPNSITMLYNLETLILSSCSELECLPPNIQNLINLRHLEIKGCMKLTHMPRGIGELTSLQTLDQFIVADNKSSESAGFVELSKLKNLRGQLEIKISGLGNKVKSESGAAQYLKDKEHLVSLSFYWFLEDIAVKEAFECLEPPQNIKAIQFLRYPGETFPNWLSLLTNLVRLKLRYCYECKYLPPLHRLSSLKELTIEYLSALEYVSEWDNDWNSGDYPSTSSMSSTTSFFPSLTKLVIRECPNLQGWWERFGGAVEPYFPMLSELQISDCPGLTSMPLFPNLKKLNLRRSSWKPLEGTMKSESSVAATPSLRNLEICGCNNLTSLPEGISNLKSLQNLEIYGCNNLTSSMSSTASFFPSLTKLKIETCPHLEKLDLQRSSSKPLEGTIKMKLKSESSVAATSSAATSSSSSAALSKLKHLIIHEVDDLESLPEEIRNLSSLQHLEIYSCNNLTSLPEGIRNLSSLQNLRISDSNSLTSLPEGISNLKSLQKLVINNCHNLTTLPEDIRSLPFLEYYA